MIKAHEISVVSDGKRVPGWKSYSITQDVLQPANAFSLDLQFNREVYDLLAEDAPVEVFLDDTRILSGFVGRREKIGGEPTLLRVTGRDKTGRLVDESARLFRYGGLKLQGLVERLVGDLFEDGVVLVNTDNRNVLRSVRARKSITIQEPVLNAAAGTFRSLPGLFGIAAPTAQAVIAGLPRVIKRPPIVTPGIFKGRQAPKKVPPGSTIWQVLEEMLAEARLMAWSSGDGRTLFVGTPAYDQGIQYLFLEAGATTGPREKTNAKITIVRDVEEMYSTYSAVGASKGNGPNYAGSVTKNEGRVFDNPENTRDGTGINFRRRKFLMVTDDGIKNQRQALERAEREKLEREAGHWECLVEVAGHSQIYAGEEPTLYAVDTIARVMDYDTGVGVEPGLPKEWYVTQVQFNRTVDSPTITRLRLVPSGTLLVT